MSINQVSIDEFRTNLAEFIGQVMYGKKRIVIKKYNRKAAMLVSIDEYESLIDPTKRLTKKEWRRRFQNLDTIRKAVPDINPVKIKKEIDQAVQEIRAEKRSGKV